MEYESPSIAETKLTGWLGTGRRTIRGVEHAVRFVAQAGEITATPARDGRPADWSATTRKMAASGFRFFGGEG